MIIVGLTGGVGTGKSTVASFFRELGAYVIDWDELARAAVHPRSRTWREIVGYFGPDILQSDSTINRRRLADIVFSDSERLGRLNSIVHPEVFKEDQRITAEIRSLDGDAVVIKDIPLLHEAAGHTEFDKVIVVCASLGTRLQRLEERGMSRDDARRRIESQLPIEEKARSADFVIDNDGPPEDTKRQVEAIYSSLREEI
jgi:dephospho-CoA kinase